MINYSSTGAQIYILKEDSLTKPLISYCSIATNYPTAYAEGTGIFSSYASPQIINNTITENTVYGIILSNSTSETSIKGNLITANNRGIMLLNTDEIVFTNNTITANTILGIEFSGSYNTKIYNSIIYNNTGSQIELSINSSSDFYYCNIQGGQAAFTGAGSGVNYSGNYKANFSLDRSYSIPFPIPHILYPLIIIWNE